MLRAVPLPLVCVVLQRHLEDAELDLRLLIEDEEATWTNINWDVSRCWFKNMFPLQDRETAARAGIVRGMQVFGAPRGSSPVLDFRGLVLDRSGCVASVRPFNAQ